MLIPSCEHATSAIPEWHRDLFRAHEGIAHSDEGWSPGALNLAQSFAIKFSTPLAHGEVTRLLVDVACRPDDPARFSRFSQGVPDEVKLKITDRHHLSFTGLLRQRIADAARRSLDPVHLSFDTFGPPESVALILRHHPTRERGREFARDWRDALSRKSPDLPVRIEATEGPGLCDLLHEEFPPPFASIQVLAARSIFLEGKPLRWEAFKKLLIETVPRSV